VLRRSLCNKVELDERHEEHGRPEDREQRPNRPEKTREIGWRTVSAVRHNNFRNFPTLNVKAELNRRGSDESSVRVSAFGSKALVRLELNKRQKGGAWADA
jgi:hypothetical protein